MKDDNLSSAIANQTSTETNPSSKEGRTRMRNQAARFLAQSAATLATLMLSLILPAAAQTIKILHDFGVTASDGNLPSSPLLKDSAGNLYGMTSVGGAQLPDDGRRPALPQVNSMISYAKKARPNAPGRQELILPGCDSGSVLAYTKNSGLAGPASSSHDLAGPACK